MRLKLKQWIGVLLLSIPSVFAQQEDGFFEAMFGDEGILGRIATMFEYEYAQFFTFLISATFIVAFATKGALEKGPLANVIEDDRQKSIIALLVGIITSNAIFWSMKGLELTQKINIIWGYIFTFLGAMLIIIIPIWIYQRWGEGRS